MLTFNLKKVWFEKIKSGEKTHEYRIVKDFWTDRLVKEFFPVDKKTNLKIFNNVKEGMLNALNNPIKTELRIKNVKICFMNGMEKEEKRPRLYGKMKSIKIVNGLQTDLKINKPVYDIEFELIKE